MARRTRTLAERLHPIVGDVRDAIKTITLPVAEQRVRRPSYYRITQPVVFDIDNVIDAMVKEIDPDDRLERITRANLRKGLNEDLRQGNATLFRRGLLLFERANGCPVAKVTNYFSAVLIPEHAGQTLDEILRSMNDREVKQCFPGRRRPTMGGVVFKHASPRNDYPLLRNTLGRDIRRSEGDTKRTLTKLGNSEPNNTSLASWRAFLGDAPSLDMPLADDIDGVLA